MPWTWRLSGAEPLFTWLTRELTCFLRFWEQVSFFVIALIPSYSSRILDLCSLRSNVDRLAFSCIWEVTPNADVVNVRYTKSIIRSKASLTYDEAQARLDDPKMNDSISLGVKALNGLAKKLRAKRIAKGALTLASPEVRFKLENDSQDPVDVGMIFLMFKANKSNAWPKYRNEGAQGCERLGGRVYASRQHLRRKKDLQQFSGCFNVASASSTSRHKLREPCKVFDREGFPVGRDLL